MLSRKRIFLLWGQASTLTSLLPCLNLPPRALTLGLQLIIASAKLGNSLFRQQFLQGPLLDILGLILLELSDELNGALQDRAFVLFAAGNDLSQLVDALIDGLSASSLN
jgi:hypothetical protein